jgi:hypothetical protein
VHRLAGIRHAEHEQVARGHHPGQPDPQLTEIYLGVQAPRRRLARPALPPKLTAITALTTQHVKPEDGRTLLHLGSRPVILPAPLNDLVAGLAAGRRRPGSSLLQVPSPWLFPGRNPGTTLTPDALGLRLHALGISPGRAAAPPCSPWPPKSPPPSWPRPSASISRPPSNGRRSPPETGLPTPPTSATRGHAQEPATQQDSPPARFPVPRVHAPGVPRRPGTG